MGARDFCYWLQGLFELCDPKSLDEKQTDLIKRHLALVFVHEIDPSTEKGSADMKKILDAIHAGEHAKPPKIGGEGPGGIVFRC